MTILAFTDGDGYYQVEVADGYPLPDWAKGMTPTSIIQPAQPSQSEIVAKATKWARAARLEFFKILDGLQVSTVVTGDNATAQSIESAKQALRNITEVVDLSSFTTYEQMEQAYIYAYWQIRQTVPANVQSAFNSLVP